MLTHKYFWLKPADNNTKSIFNKFYCFIFTLTSMAKAWNKDNKVGNCLMAEHRLILVLYESFVDYQKSLSVVEFAQNLFRNSTTKQTFPFFVSDAVANFTC